MHQDDVRVKANQPGGQVHLGSREGRRVAPEAAHEVPAPEQLSGQGRALFDPASNTTEGIHGEGNFQGATQSRDSRDTPWIEPGMQRS